MRYARKASLCYSVTIIIYLFIYSLISILVSSMVFIVAVKQDFMIVYQSK